MKTNYYIGTAGWSYKDWVPSFYPKNQTAGFDWLQFYSHYFNCVEVNSTYYAYISPKVVEGWIRKVSDSDNFIFDIKLHQDFTHKRNFNEQNIKAVRYNLDLLAKAERLGGLLIQFPYSFSFDSSSIQYIQKLRDTFPNYNCFVDYPEYNHKEVEEVYKTAIKMWYRKMLTKRQDIILFHMYNLYKYQGIRGVIQTLTKSLKQLK